MESEIGVISACIKGNFSEINDYLKDGGNLELKDRNGNTCLIAAVASDKIDTVFYLLEKGAEIGNSALLYAISRDNYSIAQILLARGADVNLISHIGKKAIDFATSSRMSFIVQCYVDKDKMEKVALSSSASSKQSKSSSNAGEHKKRESFSSMFRSKPKDKEKATPSTISPSGNLSSISIVEFLSLVLQRFSPLLQQLPNFQTTSSQWDSLVDILPTTTSYLSRINMNIKQAQNEYLYIKTHHPLLFNYYQSFCSSLFSSLLACHTILKHVIYTQDSTNNFQSTLHILAGFCSELGHLNASLLPGRCILRGIIQFLLSITSDNHRKVVIDRILQIFVYSSLENIVELLARKLTIVLQSDIVHWNAASVPQKLQDIAWLPALETHELGLSALSYLHVGSLLDHVMKISNEEFISSSLDQSSKCLPILISWASNLPIEWSPMVEDTLVVAISQGNSPIAVSPTQYSCIELNNLLANDDAYTEYYERVATSQKEQKVTKISTPKKRSDDIPSIPQRAHDILKQYQLSLPPELDSEEHKDSRPSVSVAVDNKMKQSLQEKSSQVKATNSQTASTAKQPSKPEKKSGSKCVIN